MPKKEAEVVADGKLPQPRKLRKRSLIAPVLDIDRGTELILTIYPAYKNLQGVYAMHNASTSPQNVNMPGEKKSVQWNLFDEERLPTLKIVERGSPKHLVWLFFATLTDRRQVSMDVYRAHVRLYELYPNLYTKKVLSMQEDELAKILIQFRVGCPNQSASYWIRCAKTLYEEFDGNPLRLLAYCGNSIERVQAWKNEEKKMKGRGYDPLPGYGPKITSLYTLFVAELGKMKMPEDSFPVDVHVQRLFLQYGAMHTHTDTFNEEMEDILRVFICKVAKEHNLNKVDLSHAFWQLGRTLCNGCYGKTGVELSCPIYSECLGSIQTKDYFKLGTWPSREKAVFSQKGGNRIFKVHGPLFEKTS